MMLNPTTFIVGLSTKVVHDKRKHTLSDTSSVNLANFRRIRPYDWSIVDRLMGHVIKILRQKKIEPAQCLQFVYRKDEWVKRRTADVFGLEPLDNRTEILFKDLPSTSSPKTSSVEGVKRTVAKGSLITVSYVLRNSVGGMTLKRVYSVTFVVGTPHPEVPQGLHIAVEGMTPHSKRVLLMPGELMGYTAPVNAEVWVREIRETNCYTPAQLRRLQYGVMAEVQEWWGKSAVFRWLFVPRPTAHDTLLPPHLASDAPRPATTAAEFFGDDFEKDLVET